LKFTLGSFRHRKLRTFLTVLGIFIGIAAVVTLISLTQGFETAINEQFEMMGENNIMILPGSLMTSFAGQSSQELTDHELDLIKDTSGVDNAGGMITKVAKVEFRGQINYAFIVGLPTDWNILEAYSGVTLEKGRYFKDTDRYKAGVGWLYYSGASFDKHVSTGDKININGYDFDIIGVVSKIGSPEDDQQIYIPIDVAREVLNTPTGYYVLLAKTKDGWDPEAVADNIKERLRKERGLKEGEENFEIQTMNDLKTTSMAMLAVVEFVIIGIAAISLVVGGLGIMNSVYTSVIERTREIGVMKAIGARNSDIMMIFLIEAGLLGLVGGLLGIAAGLVASKAVEWYALQMDINLLKVTLQPMLIIGALSFSFFIGVISGVVPARNAAKMRPVDALRYE